jgi:hypothetical protein
MSKQDRQGARTVEQLNRRYDVKQATVVANNAQKTAVAAEQTAKSIDKDVEAKIALKLGVDENGNLIGQVHIGANQLTIATDNFTLDADGNVQITGVIKAIEGAFGKARITTKGNAFGVDYEGFYVGEEGEDNTTFFGKSNNATYTALLGLGIGSNTTVPGVLLSNHGMQIESENKASVYEITWDELRKVVDKVKDVHGI